MNTTREEAIRNIAAASAPATGIGEEVIFGLLINVIPKLFKCLDGNQTPAQFVAAHTRRNGTPAPRAIRRLTMALQQEDVPGRDPLTEDEAGIIARRMFTEGQRHGERVGFLMIGE